MDGSTGFHDHVHTCGKAVQPRNLDWHGALAQPIDFPYKATYYKRTLPTPPCTDFASEAGKQLFQEAMIAGHTNGFFKLIQQFTTQAEPAWCGLSSLCMVMNALEIDPKRIWKGAWRWYSEDMLDCCKPLEQVKEEGITLQQAACLAQCNASKVSLRQAGTFSYEEFRQEVLTATASGTEHLIVSYSRKAFQQTGDGHFSPIGGFHPGQDQVLILDTARFKYPPHWVPLRMLYDAMFAIDSVTGKPRGYLKLASRDRHFSLLFKLSIRGDWEPAHSFAAGGCQGVVMAALAQGKSAAEVVGDLVRAMPVDSISSLIEVRTAETVCNTSLPRIQQQVLHELRHLPAFGIVKDALGSPLAEGARGSAVNGDSGPAASEDATSGSDSTVAELAADTAALSASELPRGWLLAEKCAALLYLCLPAVERCQHMRTGMADADDLASPSGRGGEPALSSLGEDGADQAHHTLEEVVKLLSGTGQSSLVSDEIAFMQRQLPSLPILDNGSDAWSEGYYACRMCSSKCCT